MAFNFTNTVNLSGYQRIPIPIPASTPEKQLIPSRNVVPICSLPVIPGSFPSSDNIRNYYLGGIIPQWRTPLPPPVATSGTSTSTTVVSTTTSGGGGSSSGPSGLPQIQTASMTIGTLNPNDQFLGALPMTGEAWNLFGVNATAAMRVRGYATPAAQSADQFRDVFTPPGLATFQDLIFDVYLDTPPFEWDFGGLTGNNNVSGVVQLIYLTVTNVSVATEPSGFVTITYSPLAA